MRTVRVRSALSFAILLGCSGGNDGGGGGGSNGGGSGGSDGGGGAAGPVTNSTSCDPDPMHTGATDRAGTDDYDCLLIQGALKYSEPDAMIFKAIIRIESGFQVDAAGCPNAPCGTPAGWSTAETQCLGLMQVVPACSPKAGDPGLLPSGHPNMTLDTSSALWATSIFNPAVNIDLGIAGVADNRKQAMAQFPGCSEEQYTLMAIGNYNQYGSTKSCTTYNFTYDDAVLKYYQQYVAASGWHPHPY